MYAAQTEYDREMERAFWLSKQKAEAIENLKQRDVMLSFTSKIEMGKDDEPPPLEPAAREPTARSRSRSPPTGIDSICALTNPTDGPYEPLAPHMQQVNDERRAKFTKKAAAACIDARQRDLKGNLDAKLWDKNGNRNWYGMNKEYQIILGMPKRFAGAAAIGRLRRVRACRTN